MKRITANISEATLAQARLEAAREAKPLAHWAGEAVEEKVAKAIRKSDKKGRKP